MAVASERPYASFRFSVSLGSARSSAGFCEVVFPPFFVAAAAPPRNATADTATPRTLLLRRGFSGTLDLYQWWHSARLAKRPRPRTVTVDLLDEAKQRPVTTWIFSGCRPVCLSYSRLDAQCSALLIESLELSFDNIEMR